MNTPQCLVCKLIESRTEMIEKGMLLLKRSQFDTPALSLAALDKLRSKPAYMLGECCETNQKRLTRCEHEMELEIARLKLRSEQLCFEQEQILAEQNLDVRLA
jgi:hypothetical protein